MADSLTEQLAAARTWPGMRNADWTPVEHTLTVNGVTVILCLVPPGTFQMGGSGRWDGQPIHTQTITEPFWIAKYPVTNAQWAIAVQAGIVPAPEGVEALAWFREAKRADCPVVGVDWFAAAQFSAWLRARLPTEREWEYAARGVDSLVFPWGNDWQPDRAVWVETSRKRPRPVTDRPEGMSWIGALHLSGNVWEWTASQYADYPYSADGRRELRGLDPRAAESADLLLTLRGGSWFDNQFKVRAAYRLSRYPSYRFHETGLRIALNADQLPGST